MHMLSSISVRDFLLNRINSNIIDIRSVERYNNNHIPGAINIEQNQLLINASKYLKKNERYYIYCQKGISSQKLSMILNNMGYMTTSISGGYEEWIMRS